MASSRTVEVDVVWDGGMSFVARTGSHHFVPIDTSPAHGGKNSGPGPMELVACAIGGCAGMDVVEILSKKRQTVSSLNVRVLGKRRADPPSVFEEVRIDFRLRGADLSEDAVRSAIELSVEKYCSVLGMVSKTAKIVPEWTIERTN